MLNIIPYKTTQHNTSQYHYNATQHDTIQNSAMQYVYGWNLILKQIMLTRSPCLLRRMCQMNLSQLQTVFVQIAKYICPNYWISSKNLFDEESPLSSQLVVEFSKLAKETVVGSHVSVLSNLLVGFRYERYWWWYGEICGWNVLDIKDVGDHMGIMF